MGVLSFLITLIVGTIITITIQMAATDSEKSEPFDFKTYSFIEWIAQLLYWGVMGGFVLYVANIAIKV